MKDRRPSIVDEMPSAYSPAKRKREGLFLVLCLVACAALGVQAWKASRGPSAAPPSLLSLEVISQHEKLIPAPYVGSSQTVLRIRVNPSALPAERWNFSKPEWQYEIVNPRWRDSLQKSWQPQPASSIGKQFRSNDMVHEIRVLYPKTGYWKATIQASFRISDPDSGGVWQDRLEQEFDEQVLPARMPWSWTDKPPKVQKSIPENVVVLDPKKTYIRKVQYSWNGTDKWKDVPRPGERGFPAEVEQNTVVGFRVVKMNPKEPWPDSPEFTPYWNYGKAKQRAYGEDVYIHFPDVAKSKTDYYPISVVCGKSYTVYVRVKPAKSN